MNTYQIVSYNDKQISPKSPDILIFCIRTFYMPKLNINNLENVSLKVWTGGKPNEFILSGICMCPYITCFKPTNTSSIKNYYMYNYTVPDTERACGGSSIIVNWITSDRSINLSNNIHVLSLWPHCTKLSQYVNIIS